MELTSSKFTRKAIFLGTIIFAQIAGIYFFMAHVGFVSSFKPYYVQSWVDSLSLRLPSNESHSLLASVGAVFSRESASSTATTTEEIASGIPVLLYHGVMSESHDETNISYSRFKEQMAALHEAGFTTVSIDDFDSFMNGTKILPRKSILITFDDGRKDSYYGADPIFSALNFRATMFLISGRLQSPFHLNSQEVKAMSDSERWDIQSHGNMDHDLVLSGPNGEKGHFLTQHLWITDKKRFESDLEMQNRIESDAKSSIEIIQKLTGKNVFSFAFPFGDYGQEMKTSSSSLLLVSDLLSAQYKYLFYQTYSGLGEIYNYPLINSKTALIKRVKPLDSWSGADLITVLEKSEPKSIPFRDDFLENKGWIPNWGNLKITGSSLTLESKDGEHGALAYLDGSRLFGNYRASAILATDETGSVSLIARNQNGDQGVVCIFDSKGIRVELRDNSGRKTLSSRLYKFPSALVKGTQFGVVVTGHSAVCEQNGIALVGAENEGISAKGGIGISIWESSDAIAKLSISSFTIEPSSRADDILQRLQREEREKDENAKSNIKENNASSTTAISIPLEISTSTQAEHPEVKTNSPLEFIVNGRENKYYVDTGTTSPWNIIAGNLVAIDGLVMHGTASSTSSIYSLDGSGSWKDYKVNMKFAWFSGTTTSILARYHDPKNYTECAFSKGTKYGSAILYVVEKGVRIPLFSSPRLLLGDETSGLNADIGMVASGSNITCLFNDYPVITYSLDRVWREGGVGVRLWDKKAEHSNILIKDMFISKI